MGLSVSQQSILDPLSRNLARNLTVRSIKPGNKREIIDMEAYDVAQICQNGHVSNINFLDCPQFNQDFCALCGCSTITKCPTCSFPIRGYYRRSISLNYKIPSFCICCGQPFPWIKSRLQAAQDLTQEINSLSAADKIILQESINDLVKDIPSTPVAATRVKRILDKVDRTTAGMFRGILLDALSDAARKVVFPF